ERADSYRRLLFQILPLAVSTQVIFRGKSFKSRMKRFKRTTSNIFPIQYFVSLLLSPFILLLLLLLVGISNLLYFINPLGEQPPKIRVVYPGVNFKSH
ncbi:MAG: hypothetical protein P8X47_07410, partial [Ignavibacteriaceae bacterium]